MDGDSTDQGAADSSDPNFGDLPGPDTAPDFASVPPTTDADLNGLGFDSGGNLIPTGASGTSLLDSIGNALTGSSGAGAASSVTSSLSAIPMWAWLALGGLVVLKVAR